MMLMMDDAVVVEKAESVEKEHSALAREIEFRLTPYLYQLGIPPHVTGYCYLRSAVVEFLLNPSEMREITKTIYPRIALEHGTTVSAVERAIRHAVATAWNNGQRGGARDSPCGCDGMEQRRSARHKGRPVHGASDVPPQADKQGLHHRVCGYDPARIWHGNRALNAEKWEITSVFTYKRQLFCIKSSYRKAAAKLKRC